MSTSITSPIILPENITDFLDSLPAYHHNPLSSSLLDLAREFYKAGNYIFQGIVTPPNGLDHFGIFASYEDEISIAPGSWVTQINEYHSGSQQNPVIGFKFQIYDVGAKTSIFNNTFGHNHNCGNLPDLATLGENNPRGSHNLMSPFCVLEPGMLHVKITNLAWYEQDIQVFIAMAVPMNRVTTQNVEMRGI